MAPRCDDEIVTWDLPVQVDHKAALGLMVLSLENLMALANAPGEAGRPRRVDFAFKKLPDHDLSTKPTG